VIARASGVAGVLTLSKLAALALVVGACGGASGDAGAPSAGTPANLSALTTESKASSNSAITAAAHAPSMSLQAVGTQTGDAVEQGLRAAAAKAAPDMQPEGPLGRAELAQGFHSEMEVSLKAGRCYALVGFGAGVQDLDLHLLTPPLYNIISEQDQSDDNTPVIGKSPHPLCPATTVDLPFKVDAFAEAGGGSIGVQLYSKPAP
jgi:hypothetical protein